MVRTPVQLEMKLRFGDHREFALRTVDLSVGGAFVASRPPQPVGTLVRFELPLPPFKKPITGFGEVLWIRVRDDGRDKPAGMGIQFRYLDEPGEDLLREFLARHAAHLIASEEGIDAEEPPLPTAALPLVRPKGSTTSVAARPVEHLEAGLWPPDLPAAPDQELAFEPAGRPDERELLSFPPEGEFPPDDGPDDDAPKPVGEAPPRRQLAARAPLIAALAALLLAVAGWWVWNGLESREETKPSPQPPASAPTSSAGEPSAATPGEVVEPPEVASAETPAAPALPTAEPVSSFDPDLVAETPSVSGELTRLISIRVGTAQGETIVVLSGDGAIAPARVTRHRLGGDRPRELLRLSGIRVPYEPPVTAVGSPELVRIRTGHHPAGEGGELYVVFDLPGSGGGIHRLEHQGGALRVYLRAVLP